MSQNRASSPASEAAGYERFCQFLEKASGITLGANKAYLVRSRLQAIQREQNTETLEELVDLLEKPAGRSLRAAVVDAMTTNETLWFRDTHPFEILKNDIFPQLAEQRVNPVQIWSAACSSGQEPYSISMCVNEYNESRPLHSLGSVRILATDISPTVLKQAAEGCYHTLELNRGLSPGRLKKFFSATDGSAMQVNADIRRRVSFREMNLLGSRSGAGRMDVVFCRNVLIYFSHENKCAIIERIVRSLKPGGYLFLGGSEPIANYSSAFEMVRCSRGVVYRLKPA